MSGKREANAATPACVSPRPEAVAAAAAMISADASMRRAEKGGPAARSPAPGPLGVVLGTGLGGLADRLVATRSVAFGDTGWLASPTATGHAGRVVRGRLPAAQSGSAATQEDVVILRGRVHGYEGHAAEALGRGVELLAALGATTVLLTNAAGGLRPDMRVGELMIVGDHIDLVRRPPAATGGWPSGVVTAGRDPAVYDATLIDAALEAARSADVVARAGVYAFLRGPCYETRAEYRMLRRFGADAVGMSTVPEALAAHRLGLRVVAVSVITNVARPDAAVRTDAEDVCRAAAGAADGVWAMLRRIAAVAAAAAVGQAPGHATLEAGR